MNGKSSQSLWHYFLLIMNEQHINNYQLTKIVITEDNKNNKKLIYYFSNFFM